MNYSFSRSTAGIQEIRSCLNYDFALHKVKEEAKLISQKLKTNNHSKQGKLVPLIYESDTGSDENPYMQFLKSASHLDANKISQMHSQSVAPARAADEKWVQYLAIGDKKWAGVESIRAVCRVREFRKAMNQSKLLWSGPSDQPQVRWPRLRKPPERSTEPISERVYNAIACFIFISEAFYATLSRFTYNRLRSARRHWWALYKATQ